MPDTTPYATPNTTPWHIRSKKFIDEIRNVKKKKKNSEIFIKYFGCQNPSFLAEDLFNDNQDRNIQIVNQTINSINELKNSIIKKEISENENRNKIIDIGLKILTPKEMLQRLPIALAQVKAGKNSKDLLNEIRQIAYYLYESKEITKKVYNNIIKSIQI